MQSLSPLILDNKPELLLGLAEQTGEVHLIFVEKPESIVDVLHPAKLLIFLIILIVKWTIFLQNVLLDRLNLNINLF